MRILHLTDIPPCTNYTAGIVQLHLSRFLLNDRHVIKCFAVVDPSLQPDIPEDIKNSISFKIVSKPREDYGNSKYGKVASLLGNNYNAAFKLPKIVKEIADFIQDDKIDIIWAVVQGQTMIRLLRMLYKKLHIPYVVEVWDPPQWWLNENKFDSFTYRQVMKDFAKVLYDAKCCLAASQNMAIAYKDLYGASTQAVIPGLDDSLKIPLKRIDTLHNFLIGFAGQMYAKDEFAMLLEALNRLNWTYNGRRIKVVLYGAYFHLNFARGANVILRGWEPQETVLEELSGMDLLYCPYWFSEKYSVIAKLSFPSKLTTYLKTKVPVLIHAPRYASISTFIKDGINGYRVTSLNPDEIKNVLMKIIDNAENKNVGQGGYELYLQHLTASRMKNNFYKALEI